MVSDIGVIRHLSIILSALFKETLESLRFFLGLETRSILETHDLPKSREPEYSDQLLKMTQRMRYLVVLRLMSRIF